MDDWRVQIAREFDDARRAREQGNAGRARVCARRAAGIAIREHLLRRGRRVTTPSAYDLLNALKADPGLAPELLPAVEHLTVRVTEEFKLPVEADLIEEARRLCAALLPDWDPGPAAG
jgi:hypothetical protein